MSAPRERDEVSWQRILLLWAGYLVIQVVFGFAITYLPKWYTVEWFYRVSVRLTVTSPFFLLWWWLLIRKRLTLHFLDTKPTARGLEGGAKP